MYVYALFSSLRSHAMWRSRLYATACRPSGATEVGPLTPGLPPHAARHHRISAAAHATAHGLCCMCCVDVPCGLWGGLCEASYTCIFYPREGAHRRGKVRVSLRGPSSHSSQDLRAGRQPAARPPCTRRRRARRDTRTAQCANPNRIRWTVDGDAARAPSSATSHPGPAAPAEAPAAHSSHSALALFPHAARAATGHRPRRRLRWLRRFRYPLVRHAYSRGARAC